MHPQSKQRNNYIGIALMAGYALSMVTCDATAKRLSINYDVITVVWYRYFFHTISLIFIACLHFLKFRETEYVENHPIQLLRGLTLVISTIFFFQSIALMPLAEALALLYVFPIVSVILCVIFLKEPFTRMQGAAVVAAFTGALLILQPTTDMSLRPGLLAICGGVFMGIYMFLTKTSSRSASPNMASLYTGVVGILLIPFFPNFELFKLDEDAMVMAGFMGLFAAIGHYLMFMSMRYSAATVVSPYAFSEVLFASLIGYIWFGDTLNFMSGIAIILLITSGIIFARLSNRTNQ